MDVKEMALTLKRLETNFNKKMTKQQKIEWYENFKELDVRYFARAVTEINRHNKFFPTIYEMSEAIEKVEKEDFEFSEEEKAYKMRKQNIIPKWLGKKIESTQLTEEEEKELKTILEEFKNE